MFWTLISCLPNSVKVAESVEYRSKPAKALRTYSNERLDFFPHVSQYDIISIRKVIFWDVCIEFLWRVRE